MKLASIVANDMEWHYLFSGNGNMLASRAQEHRTEKNETQFYIWNAENMGDSGTNRLDNREAPMKHDLKKSGLISEAVQERHEAHLVVFLPSPKPPHADNGQK